MVVIAPCAFVLLFFISAPYGRYLRAGWGPTVSSRTGWLLMEAPASLLMLSVLLLIPVNFVVYLFLGAWQVHYFHRAFVYPFTLTSRRRIPMTVVVMAIVFNSANAFLNGYHFVLHQDWYGAGMADPLELYCRVAFVCPGILHNEAVRSHSGWSSDGCH